ncbi:winged helix-turn-helix domain-containing protein [Brevibacterium spongiae]|uniref:Winged helix-turn-helix domain-containing protein n=1 Tax=Brevibacterium spongiae TaxID=2909672 RepID=A0ABY5SN27_9MICO|nr:winged helix-turn-helix domain-containing protein [Brevibacterium spongiae]UVI35549.1 winged helix-turn-helix domain-containing protein [Brevibacterium spongiae]
MRILHICPTDRLDAPVAPESLQYLGHHIDRIGAEAVPTADRAALDADVVVADACLDLSVAPRIAELLAARRVRAPIIVVLGEGGLATASAKWNVSDLILTTAGPAEVEARLRVARDRHLESEWSAAHTSAHGLSSGRGVGSARGVGSGRGTGAAWGAGSGRGLSPAVGTRGITGGGFAGRSGANRTGEALDGEGPWNADGEPMIVVTGTLRIDETAFTADLGGRSLDLTYREFALLKFFALHPERVFTRDEILLAVWGDDYFGGTRTVDVHVRRLRAKLGKDLENAIHTVRNVGYRFSADSVTESEDEEDVKA